MDLLKPIELLKRVCVKVVSKYGLLALSVFAVSLLLGNMARAQFSSAPGPFSSTNFWRKSNNTVFLLNSNYVLGDSTNPIPNGNFTSLTAGTLSIGGTVPSNLTVTGTLTVQGTGTSTFVGPVSATTSVIGYGYPSITESGTTYNAKASLRSDDLNIGASLILEHNATSCSLLGCGIWGYRSRGDRNTKTIVQDRDSIGSWYTGGYDGEDYEPAAAILSVVDGVAETDMMFGALEFYTNNGSQTLSKQFTLSSDGSSDFAGDVDVVGYVSSSELNVFTDSDNNVNITPTALQVRVNGIETAIDDRGIVTAGNYEGSGTATSTFAGPVSSTRAIFSNLAENTSALAYLCVSANGTVYKDSSTTCLLSKDALKDNLRPMTDMGLETLLRLESKEWEWKPGLARTGYDFGFSANQAATVDERLITREADGSVHGFRYEELSAVVRNAFKELNDKVKAQQREIDDLNLRLIRLEKMSK